MHGNHGIWLCLYFEQLPLECFVRNLSSGNKRPVVILDKARVSFLNKTASSIGICPGNSMDTALAPGETVVSFERDPSRESSVLAHLAQWAYQFTPNVSIKAPDSLLLDITGCLRLFNGLDNLKETIREKVAELGYTAVIGVNKTPLAALYIAHAGMPDNTGELVPSLGKIPVDCLQVERKIIDSLKQTGIHDLGGLLKLPESGLSRRFGVSFTKHLQKLTGRKADPQIFISPEPEFSSEMTFLSDVTNLDSLIFPVSRLLSELGEFLNARQLYVNQFTWSLSHRNQQTKSFDVQLSRPDNDIPMFKALTTLHLDKLDDVEEVDSLRLSTIAFSPASTSSGDLFHDTRAHLRIHDRHARRGSDKLLNMLHARLGPQSCFGLSLANDHRPEKAWKRVRPNKAGDWYLSNPRPFYLLNSPEILKSGENLTLLKGPERIDFGWWDQAGSQMRDYYIARHSNGSLYWVFNNYAGTQQKEKWYIHGIFS